MGWPETERYPERDKALRETGETLLAGRRIPPDLAEQFFSGVAQIAARAALRMEMGGETIDEVVGDTLLRVFGAMLSGSCVPMDSPMAAYVSIVARRKAISIGKKQAVRERREVPQHMMRSVCREKWPPERPVEDRVAARLALEQVKQAIGRLPAPQRVIVEMLPTHSHGEICDRLRITDSALRNRLLRARQQLHRDCPNLFD